MPVAQPRLDPIEARLVNRRVPCICPRQHEPAPPHGATIDFHTQRGTVIERVRCSSCGRTWTRIEA